MNTHVSHAIFIHPIRQLFQLATVTPGVQRIVKFEVQNTMVTAWPGIQIGYKQPTKQALGK